MLYDTVECCLRSEDVAKLIPSWKPWWMYYNNSKVEETDKEDKYKSTCPKLCDIKEFSQITVRLIHFYKITCN